MKLIKNHRFYIILGLYFLFITLLSVAWYGNFVPFHLFDDTLEWGGMDKLGHAITSFYIGFICFHIFNDQHPERKPFVWAWSGIFLMFPIEVLDGLSPKYGASLADLLANAMGSLGCFLYLKNSFPIVLPRFSFHYSLWATLRPSLLGDGFLAPIIKDYNGQTYWYSVSLGHLFPFLKIQPWICVAIGVGVDGFLGGHDNVWENANSKTLDYSHIQRTHRVVFSLDVLIPENLTDQPVLRWLVRLSRIVKCPAPAIEWNATTGWNWHWIYF